MARRSNAALLANPALDRQAKRIGRQQKRLEKEVQLTQEALPMVSQRATPMRLKSFDPLTDHQRDFWEAYDDGETAFLLYGSAGTGKTFQAVYKAIQDVLDPESEYDKIVIVRSTVQVRDMGFLPGTDEEKCAPYEEPYMQIFSELFGKKEAYQKFKDMGKIEFASSSFLRGVTFRNAIVIGDEIQNMNWGEISTLITRMSDSTKLILCGDFAQNDLTKSKTDVSGFEKLKAVTDLMPEFIRVKYSPDDIVRGAFVKSFIMACERLGF